MTLSQTFLTFGIRRNWLHYSDVIMSAMASQITSLMTVYWTVYSGADWRKHQSSVLLAFVRWIHRWPVNSPHKGPVTRKMFPFDDVIMERRVRITYHLRSPDDCAVAPVCMVTTFHSPMWLDHGGKLQLINLITTIRWGKNWDFTPQMLSYE